MSSYDPHFRSIRPFVAKVTWPPSDRARRRHHRHRRDRPTRRIRSRTRTVRTPPPWACSGWRRRCRSLSERWSNRAYWTGPGSPSGCPTRRPGFPASRVRGRPIAVGEPANITLVDPAATWVVDPAHTASCSRNTPTRDGVARTVRATFLHRAGDGLRFRARAEAALMSYGGFGAVLAFALDRTSPQVTQWPQRLLGLSVIVLLVVGLAVLGMWGAGGIVPADRATSRHRDRLPDQLGPSLAEAEAATWERHAPVIGSTEWWFISSAVPRRQASVHREGGVVPPHRGPWRSSSPPRISSTSVPTAVPPAQWVERDGMLASQWVATRPGMSRPDSVVIRRVPHAAVLAAAAGLVPGGNPARCTGRRRPSMKIPMKVPTGTVNTPYLVDSGDRQRTGPTAPWGLVLADGRVRWNVGFCLRGSRSARRCSPPG